MTENEALASLSKYCEAKVKKSGWWIFWKRNISFKPTVLLDPWEKITNLPLPAKISFPADSNDLIIDGEGIRIGNNFYHWSGILATGIKIESNDDWTEEIVWSYSLLCCLSNGKIMDIPLLNPERFHGQIGDLIEQYKQVKKL